MRVIRKYGLWIVICTLACVIGAWAVSGLRAVQYTSTANVDVEAAAIPGSTPTLVNTVTEKQVASSGVVLNRAAKAAGMTPDQLASHISIAVPSGANVLAISCTTGDPVSAQRCATAVSDAYMNFRNDAGQGAHKQAHDALAVTLVTPAQVPTNPSGLGLAILLPLGAVIGLLLGTGTAYIRDRTDDRVRDREDLEQCLGTSVLAVVPRTRNASQAARIFTDEPGSPSAEAYRYLRTHVEPLLQAGPAGGKVLLVTGAQRQEGRSSVAANLASSLARAGRKVILVDADLRAGLTDLLAGRASLADVAVSIPNVSGGSSPRADAARSGLQLITAGRDAGDASDVLHSESLEHAIEEMRAAADVIVVDSGPALSVSDPIAIAQQSDLVLQVANVRRTMRQSIRAAAQELRTSGDITLLGVLTGVSRPLTFRRPEGHPAPAPAPDRARSTAGTRELAARDARAMTGVAQVATGQASTGGMHR
jgi:Mrp family chromosome partitioning ATPase/capsular polysaccharide biosynthesis protein